MLPSKVKQELKKDILEQLKFEPTKSQSQAIDKLLKFLHNKKPGIFILKGYAGTGKTSLIGSIIKGIDYWLGRTALLTPTGRAANVFSKYAEYDAFTIHQFIFQPLEPKNPFTKFILKSNFWNEFDHTKYFVDEASMIGFRENPNDKFGSGSLLKDLIEFIFTRANNNKLIFIGDDAQLPPINDEISYALDKNFLQKNFDIKTDEFTLTDIVRQKKGSGIIHNAQIIRDILLSQTNEIPKFNVNNIDVFKDYFQEFIPKLSNFYKKSQLIDNLVITYSNKTALAINKFIRKEILEYDKILEENDQIIIIRNNYFWDKELIANGDLAIVKKIFSIEKKYSLHFADVELHFIDYDKTLKVKIILDTLTMDSASLPKEKFKQFYDNLILSFEAKSKKELYEKLAQDPYYNALHVKYAYAITCHKAQGGQWKNVFVFYPHSFNNSSVSLLRWLYTAITRAQENLYLIDFPSFHFNN